MRVFGSYPCGALSQRRNQSAFTLLPTRVISGASSPPINAPLEFCVAWQEAQKSIPYTPGPSTAACSADGKANDAGAGAVEFTEALLWETRKFAISEAS